MVPQERAQERASWKPMVSPKPPENEKIVQAIRVMLDFGAYDIAIQFLEFIKEKKLKKEVEANVSENM